MKFTINQPTFFFNQKEGYDDQLKDCLEKGKDSKEILKKIHDEMETTTLGKITIASEQMLDLA
jgi:hypothetical protein